MTKVFKFLRLTRHASIGQDDGRNEDLTQAYNTLICRAQKPLTGDRRFQTWKYQFQIYTDSTSGILRCKGRLANASILVEAKFPIILDKEHAITHLIVKQCHEKSRHSGIYNTLAGRLELTTGWCKDGN